MDGWMDGYLIKAARFADPVSCTLGKFYRLLDRFSHMLFAFFIPDGLGNI